MILSQRPQPARPVRQAAGCRPGSAAQTVTAVRNPG